MRHSRRLLQRLRLKRSSSNAPILFRKPAVSAEMVLLLRAVLVVALFAGVYVIFYWDREGLRDNLDGVVSGLDVLYFTMITITTVGYGDIVPVTDQARLVDALVATPVRIFVWFIFLGTAYQFVIQRVIEDFKMSRLQRKLEDHIVICGYGDSGRRAAVELLARGVDDESIVVIDNDEHRIRHASESGYIGLHGEATREELLRVAAVERARAVIIAVGRDDTALLTLLTVRAIGCKARVIVSIREAENAKLVREGGADVIVSPWQVGGCLLADAVDQEHIVSMAQELLAEGGASSLIERPVRTDEIGRALNELSRTVVLAVRREGRQIRFWDAAELRLAAGDVLIAVDANGG